jgi:hypothetical protein
MSNVALLQAEWPAIFAAASRAEAAKPQRVPTAEQGEASANGRWRVYTYDELIARENEVSVEAYVSAANVEARSTGRNHKACLDIFWLRGGTLADSGNLPALEAIAQEIVADVEAALEPFRLIAAALNGGRADA